MKNYSHFLKLLVGFGIAFWALALSAQNNAISKVTSNHDTPSDCYEFDSPTRISWDSTYHRFYTWSANGDLVRQTNYEYNGNAFSPVTQITYTYDNNSRLTSNMIEEWSANAWKNLWLFTLAYDAQGNETLFYSFQWRTTPFGMAWDTVGGTKRDYVYNANQQIEVETVFNRTAQGWDNHSRMAYHYDIAQQPDTIRSYIYLGAWIERERKVAIAWHDYSKYQFSTWISEVYSAGNWANDQRSRCDYNGNDFECWTENWNGNGWDSTQREVRNFDSLGAQRLVEYYTYNGSWQRDISAIWTYTYDGQGRKLETILQNFDQLLQAYVNTSRIVCNNFFTAQNSVQDLDFEVEIFPNPVAESLTIRLPSSPKSMIAIRIYDLRGNLRQSGRFSGSEMLLDMRLLENGEYILQLAEGNRFKSQKIIVAH